MWLVLARVSEEARVQARGEGIDFFRLRRGRAKVCREEFAGAHAVREGVSAGEVPLAVVDAPLALACRRRSPRRALCRPRLGRRHPRHRSPQLLQRQVEVSRLLPKKILDSDGIVVFFLRLLFNFLQRRFQINILVIVHGRDARAAAPASRQQQHLSTLLPKHGDLFFPHHS